jgi:hypothetical protein
MEKLNFSNCDLAPVDTIFKLTPLRNMPFLSDWVATDFELTDFDKQRIKHLSENIDKNFLHWNDAEFARFAIGPMFALVDFTERYRFNLFARGAIAATVDGIALSGKVDEIITTGFRAPELPFFVFTQWKKETNGNVHPAGETLAAMLAAQVLNAENGISEPIYGAYCIGSDWYFVALKDRKYAISKSFYSTEYEDSLHIFRILSQLKVYCLERTAHIIVEN